MSKLTKYKCDNCNDETTDVYQHKGWVLVEGDTIAVSKGRRIKDNMAETISIDIKDKDFCSIKCFFQYVSDKIKAHQKVKS